MLGAIEPPPDAAEQIEAMGPQAVNVACEAALGTYIELRPKVRTNAAAVVGRMNNEQARETLALLKRSTSPATFQKIVWENAHTLMRIPA